MQRRERSSSESYFWPILLAVGLHLVVFAMLFVSFSMAPDLPPAKPIVQATLYQLKSQSQATTQTNQKIAGEAKKTAARQYEVEQMEQKRIEQQQVQARAAEQKKVEEARRAEVARQAAAEAARQQAAEEAKKQAAAEAARKQQAAEAAKKQAAAEAARKQAAEEAKKQAAAEAARKKAAEEAKKQAAAEEARKKAAEEAKKQAAAEAAQKKAAEEAKKQAAAEEARKKAAEEAKKQAAAEAARKRAAEEAKKKAAAEAARKAAEDKKAQALAELLSDTTERQQALAAERGSQVAGDYDDLIVSLVSQQWRRPPSARNGMSVEVLIQMLPDGTITSARVTRSSGDTPFDNSAVAAVRNVGRIPELRQLDRASFDRNYRQRRMIFKPEDLEL